MDALYLTLLAAGALVFGSVVAGLLSARAGLSFLLVFLVAGMLAGEDGPGGFPFDDFRLAFWVGNIALAVILLDGGLRTPFATFRTGLRPAMGLATLGVCVTAAVTGAGATLLLDIDWRLGLLAGAIVGSTDAAAVFSLMRTASLRLTERMASTLEIESGLNDPMAVFLTLMLIAWLTVPGDQGGWALAQLLAAQAGWGLAIGLGAGVAAAAGLQRLPLSGGQEGIAGLLLLSSGVAVFAGTSALGGSGFLAVYLYGLMLRQRAGTLVLGSLSAMDGYAWLAQAAMFLLLGLLVTPSRIVETLLPALGVAAVLMVLARPLAVWLCLAPLRFTGREIAFVSWVGLRGAVPIVLAVFPVVAGVPGARPLFDIAFVVVLASLLLQGSTLRWAAQRCGVNLPDAADEPAVRATFGDFAIDPQAPLEALCEFYALPVPPDAEALSVSDWVGRQLKRPPVAGDVVALAGARLCVRRIEQGRIGSLGLALEPGRGGD
jgi:cell volume regulation protein A